MCAHIILAALNFEISSKKSLCELKKNDTCSVNFSISVPLFLAFSKYVIAFAKVNASS